MMSWKAEVLKGMGLEWLELLPEEWLLLLLSLDDYEPLLGEESLHTILFLYPYSPFNFTPLLITVYSREVSNALMALVSKGLVRRGLEFREAMPVEVIRVTAAGRREGLRLIDRVRRSWLLLRGFVVKRGKQVIDELTALKRTYNGRGPATLLKLLLNHVESGSVVLEQRLGRDACSYLKKVYRSYLRDVGKRRFL